MSVNQSRTKLLSFYFFHLIANNKWGKNKIENHSCFISIVSPIHLVFGFFLYGMYVLPLIPYLGYFRVVIFSPLCLRWL